MTQKTKNGILYLLSLALLFYALINENIILMLVAVYISNELNINLILLKFRELKETKEV